MFGTFFSLISLILLFQTQLGQVLIHRTDALPIIQLITAAVTSLLIGLTHCLFYLGLQQAESNLTPRVINLFRTDQKRLWASRGLVLFALVSVIFAGFTELSYRLTLVSIWIVGLGAAFDLAWFTFRRWASYLDPIHVIDEYVKQAEKAIASDNPTEITIWWEALTEIGLKGISDTNYAIARTAINQLQGTAALLWTVQDKEKEQTSNALLFHLLEQLDFLCEQAIERNIAPIIDMILTAYAKIALVVQRCDSRLFDLPLHKVAELASNAQIDGDYRLLTRASIAMQQLAKQLADDEANATTDLRAPLFSVVAHLEEIAQNEFRENKSCDIDFLVEPFEGLKAFFEAPRFNDRPGIDLVKVDLNRIIGDFQALRLVMAKLPVEGADDAMEKEEEPET